MRFSLMIFMASLMSTVVALEPLRLFTISKRGLLEDDVQKKLQGALKWFELAIQIDRPPVTDAMVQSVRAENNGYDSTIHTVTVTTPDKTFSFDYQSPKFDKLLKHAIPIYLEEDSSQQCTAGVLASAGSPVFHNDGIHTMFMKICVMNLDATTSNIFDLFRHEILHGLGFGTLDVVGDTEQYKWKDEGLATEQDATRRMLKLNGGNDVKAIRRHFNCQEGAEMRAESDDQFNHLNEYIFGTELMTSLVGLENYFSYISAEILEKTYKGSKPWYKVNTTFIAPEADLYDYGKGLGCEFLLKSCWEAFEARKDMELVGPFCRSKHMDPSTYKLCMEKGGQHYQTTCNDGRKLRVDNGLVVGSSVADNGIVLKGPLKLVQKYRYCPVSKIDLKSYVLQKCQ